MYKLNQYIDQHLLEDRVINKDIWIENKVLYVTLGNTQYKYNKGNYWQKSNESWINLQGGVPDYTLESDSNPDENIFYEVKELTSN